ncbi:MAG: serine phosphatase RsbU (regulator of sigma subunit) [Crocinitomix sp.]|jgi:serine phosphatase RsbU (regulator of sigma subunit)
MQTQSSQLSEVQHQELVNAQIIQQGLLPKSRHFNRIFEESFIMYQPQNIISGDFYWVGKRNNLKYLVVGDCTGHGISAALLSVLAINLFQYAIMTKGIKKTDEILREVDRKFIESFKNSEDKTFDNPWIELSIVCINEEKKQLQFSSANRKLMHVTNSIMSINKGNRYPIGGWQLENNRLFESQEYSYAKGDILYLGSDGFQDQIGGERNKKYKSRRLHQFLLDQHQLGLSTQKERLEQEFDTWKDGNEQLDDVCIVGVKL